MKKTGIFVSQGEPKEAAALSPEVFFCFISFEEVHIEKGDQSIICDMRGQSYIK